MANKKKNKKRNVQKKEEYRDMYEVRRNGKSRKPVTRKKIDKEDKTEKEKETKRLRKTEVEKETTKALKRVKKKKFKDKHPKLAWTIRIAILLLLIFMVIAAGIVIGVIYGAFGDDFKISLDELTIKSSNSIIVDQDGNVIAELSGDENRQIITLDEMSPYLVDAYVSIEDERFFEHDGVDLYRTGGAIFTFVTHAGNSSFGGSTITQQLVKNITKDDQDAGVEGILRKAKEWSKAYQVERMLSKNQILELYLNIIFVGGSDNHGVQTASKYYFNKNASDLTLVECAFLAGINNGPNGYNPFGEKGYGVDEAKTNKINNKTKIVLNKMNELGKISKEDYDNAIKEVNEKGVTFNRGITTTKYSYHTDALINQAIEDIATQKNISKSLAETYLYSSGLTIYSTEKVDIQANAEKAVNNSLRITSSETKDENGNFVQNQAAMVIIDHKTGYVLGCVGGVGEKDARGLNRATQSFRQPGSTIKPIGDVAPGLEEKILTIATIYNDSKTKFKTGSKTWEPKNYSTFRGNITIRQAIETSQNIPFAKVMAELGVSKSIDYLEKMGITSLSRENEGLALSIGGLYTGISPLEMTAAYATIANDGVYIEPTFYTKIVDSDGNIVLQKEQKTQRVFSETTCALMKNLLMQPVLGASGTARTLKMNGIDVAAKTGTTNDDKDRWLCGFTNYYTASVWYGYDKPETIICRGTSPANKIWEEAMKNIHSGLENSKFTLNNNIVSATICRESGKLATDTCTDTYSEIFEKGTIPHSCDGHKNVVICNDTQLLANEYCTNTSALSNTYLVDKEKLGKWETSANNGEITVPTTYCTEHKKVEITVEILEPEKPSTPEENTGTTPENPTNPDNNSKPGETTQGGSTNTDNVSKPGNTTNPDNTTTPNENQNQDNTQKPNENQNQDNTPKPEINPETNQQQLQNLSGNE